MTRPPSATSACNHCAQATLFCDLRGFVTRPSGPASSSTARLTSSHLSVQEETAYGRTSGLDPRRERGIRRFPSVLCHPPHRSIFGATTPTPHVDLWREAVYLVIEAHMHRSRGPVFELLGPSVVQGRETRSGL